jgi:2-succinyl-6-hydroxy-2,4-cyclohexadiene-1-carboxylate synthase
MGNSNDFKDCIPQLCQSFRCLSVDLPGHGKTEVLGDESYYTISKTATLLIGLLNHLNLSKVYLFGYSMGGRLAFYLMLHYPQYFHKVMIESASPGLRTNQARSQRLQTDFKRAEQLENQPFKQFLIDWYNQPLFNTLKQHSKFNLVFNRRLQNNPDELAKSLRNLGTGRQPSLWDKLASHNIPLLLIVGELDQKFMQINQEIVGLSDHAKLDIIPKCGHNIHIENTNQWIKTILDFTQLL